MKIQGIAGMTADQLNFELKRGGRFVIFPYCVSLLLVTLRRPSPIYSLRGGESSIIKGLPFTLLSLVAGWGDSLGTHLHGAVGLSQPARRQERHFGSSRLAQ